MTRIYLYNDETHKSIHLGDRRVNTIFVFVVVSILFGGTTFGLAYAVDDDGLFEIGRGEGTENVTNIIDDEATGGNPSDWPDWSV